MTGCKLFTQHEPHGDCSGYWPAETTETAGGAASAASRRVIYKYALTLDGLMLELTAPRVVHVGQDPAHEGWPSGSSPSVWIEHQPEIDVDHPRHSRIELQFVPTGIDVPETPWAHVGSCVCGPFVWHVYQRLTLLWAAETLIGTLGATMTAQLTPEAAVQAFVTEHGYWAGDLMPDGRVAFLMPQIFGVDICIGAEATEDAGLTERYSYNDASIALAAWSAWREAEFFGEPVLWIRHRPSNRRRPSGDASREEVRP